MQQCFLILGYGIPKDITLDENYGIYLKTVFNNVFEACTKSNNWDATIIFSGGKTDMVKPYRRSEAQEMIKYFKLLMRRTSVRDRVKRWHLIPEKRSYSTLDNFLYTKEILKPLKADTRNVIVFGEKTRHRRIIALTKKTLPGAKIMIVDFDQSANRYLDPDFLRHKESEVMKFDLWALKSPNNLKKHRELFKQKFVFLRQAGPEKHVQAVKEWWEEELKKIVR
ncbi:MAG: ElyC/SanA/YdcF family protein [Patescibacteria group bacterium]|nr:ElyC/SanA/YdcF family protein [Patescibacteria group bacterium]